MSRLELSALPIREKFDEIANYIKTGQVVVIAGETGSGKTTQLPQICYELGLAESGAIAVTQPRRIAATSTAARVAEELSVELGDTVGYRVRFDEKCSGNSKIIFMTDGMLLQEMTSDRELSKYSVVIIDEAHERSLNIDFILGCMRRLLSRRSDLKLIIASATIDTTLFSESFNKAPVVEVSGRMFPVEVIYEPVDYSCETYIEATVSSIRGIVESGMDGDILVFLPTERDIREVQASLGNLSSGNTVLPLFARLTSAEQNRIFHSFAGRKIVLSTNIAETSLTVPGIRFVVDSGLVRLSRYSSSLRTNRLPIERISQAEARQRAGRCGRVAEGICIRLYEESEFNEMELYRTAEIKRSNLAGVILSLLSMRLGDIERFPFIEPPEKRTISDAFSQLYELGAVSKGRHLTQLGKKMARLPLEPHVARMIIEAQRLGVVEAVLVVCAGLSIVDPRERPQDQLAEADLLHQKFYDKRSDFLTMLKLWETYHEKFENLRSLNKMRRYCRDNFLNFNRMREWVDVYKQIAQGLGKRKHLKTEFASETGFADAVHKSVLAGLVSSIALYKDEERIYRATRNRKAYIFPGSVLAKRKKSPPWIMAHEFVETSRLFARTVAPIDPKWVEELIPHLLKRVYGEPRYEFSQGSVLVDESLLFGGLLISEGRRRFYGSINRADAVRIFIQSALIENNLPEEIPAISANRDLYLELMQQEAKMRDVGYLLSDEEILQLYLKRIPEVASLRELRGWIKKSGGDSSLRFKREDLLRASLPERVEKFPDSFQLGDKSFELSYRYAPGEPDDGLTVKIPLGEIPYINEDSFSWLVKPLWAEKISALLKTLPKSQRKLFVPIQDSGKLLASHLNHLSPSFCESLARCILKTMGVEIDPNDFREEEIADHLKMNVEIIGNDGGTIRQTRDLKQLRDLNSEFSISERSLLADHLNRLARHNITSWDFGDLPLQVEVAKGGEGVPLIGYPALKDMVDSVSLVYESDRDSAEKTHQSGVRRLLNIRLQCDIDWLERDIRFPKDIKVMAAAKGGAEKLSKRVVDVLVSDALSPADIQPRSESEFEKLYNERRSKLVGAGYRAVELIGALFAQWSQIRAVNRRLESKHRVQSYRTLAKELLLEMEVYEEQFFEGYLTGDLFWNYLRYMRGFEIRMERAFQQTSKYRLAEENLISHQNRAASYVEESRNWHPTILNELDRYLFMIEEYALSLFAAPEIKPAIPISEKRLLQQDEKINKMVKKLS